MDDTDGKFSPFINKNVLPLALGMAGLVFFGYGLMSLQDSRPQDEQDILFEAASTSKVPEKAEVEIAVDVAGAVMKPGVYKLASESRVQDALVAAGGMSEDADREKVAKTLNLASKISDGAKIYVPVYGEEVAVSSKSLSAESVLGDVSDVININDATSEQLEALPGVGKVTAAKIIDNRPYGDVQDLLDKKVVGSSVFEKIKDKVAY